MTLKHFRPSARVTSAGASDRSPSKFEACLSNVILLDDGTEFTTSCFVVGQYEDADVAIFHAQQAALVVEGLPRKCHTCRFFGMDEYHPGTPRNTDGTYDLSNVALPNELPGNCLRPRAALPTGPTSFSKRRGTNWTFPRLGEDCPTWTPLKGLIQD